MPRSCILALLGALIPVLHGCGEKKSESKPFIVLGKEANGKEFPTVSLQKADSQGVLYSFCSGVLISTRHVLTAAHCSVKGHGHTWKVVDYSNFSVVPYDSRPEHAQALRLPVAHINVYPEYNPKAMERNEEGLIIPAHAGDLALWTLAQDAPQGPIANITTLEEVDSILKDGTSITIMGFGKKSGWDSPWTEPTLAMAETRYFSSVEMSQSKMVVENGRRFKKSVIHKIPGRSHSEFFAGGRNLPDTCKGDSGGPAFIKTHDQQLRLIGITSRGALGCDQGGVYTLLPFFQSWMNQVLQEPR